MTSSATVSPSSVETRKAASNPPQVPMPIRGYYSSCVRVSSGPLLFISGQLGTDVSGTLISVDDVGAQAAQALHNIELLLQAHGASMADVVKVTVYVTDIDYLDLIAPARLKYFSSAGPASAIVEVSGLAVPGAKVEIEAIAAVG